MRDQTQEAARVIRSGGVVIAPTETFYCLAADPLNSQAVVRIFELKRRATNKPLPLIAATPDAAQALIKRPTPAIRRLMQALWPGSLTILAAPSAEFPPGVVSEAGYIGIRAPIPNPATLLAHTAGGIITATSANLSGEPPPPRVQEISVELLEVVDLILDCGDTPGGLPSTLVIDVDDSVRILRPGAISREVLERVLGRRVFME